MSRHQPGPRAGSSPDGDSETTASLLARVREGDAAARDRLVVRYLATLRRWAHGRLPRWARDVADTDDLVQNTLLRALDQVRSFEPRREGAFLSYLRRILLNQVKDEIRRVTRRPDRDELTEGVPDPQASPLVEAIGAEALERYEAALAMLTEEQQQAVVLRIELGYTHEQVAEALGSPSVDAARMLVARGLVRLTEAMDAGR